MDSWTPQQLQIMKLGGNQKCQSYLSGKGIPPSTPIKPKYESDAAQLYKEILKARAEGRPEPTELPPKRPPSSGNARPMSSISSSGKQDPNGMERLVGETDEQYVARQTRLRDEARARMAAKFGNDGRMGAAGGSRMGGVGSDPGYDPNRPYGSEFDVAAIGSTVISGLGSAFGALSTVASSVTAAVQDEGTQRHLTNKFATI